MSTATAATPALTSGALSSWPLGPNQNPSKRLVLRNCKSHFLFGIPTDTFASTKCGLLLRSSSRLGRKGPVFSRTSTKKRPWLPSPVMEWQDCSAEIEVDVPSSVAYNCYSDRESIPLWMPFIDTVKVLKDKPDISSWTLKYTILGNDIEFSWLARNLQPIRNQKIHWRSLEGLPNRGAVRFYPKGSSSCKIELTVSYEIPQILAPVASALKPALKSLLLQGLEQFGSVAKAYQSKPDTTLELPYLLCSTADFADFPHI